jgi:uncharacterized membrane protein
MNEALFFSLLTGGIFLIAGFFLFIFPPKNINGLYGYRSSFSMKSQEIWDYAQKYAGKQMMKAGLILKVIGILFYLFSIPIELAIIFELIALLVVVILMLYFIDKQLRKQFPIDPTN